MGVKLTVKILAKGLIFAPSTWLHSMSGMLDVLIFSVNMAWMAWMLPQVQPFSMAKMFMILHCFWLLRIFILVLHMRKVVAKLCKGFKKIFLIAVPLIILMFIFANKGVHRLRMKVALCNSMAITNQTVCTNQYYAKLVVTKMNLKL